MQKPISYHNFMFPFRFDKIIEPFSDRHEFYKNYSFDKRVCIDETFYNKLKDNGWKYIKFEVKSNLDYNELVYFYDFVKDSLFNVDDVFEKSATSYYFSKKDIKKPKYLISINVYKWDKEKQKNIKTGEKNYELELKSISLRVFDTGVGILSFEIENNKYSALEDILNINEYGRRIYPQYLGENFDVEATKGSFLANYLEVNGIKETFDKDYKSEDIILAEFITETLGELFTTDKKSKDRYFIQPILDDRMFVMCWYGNNDFSSRVKDNEYETIDNWYEFVYIDKYNNKMVQNSTMQKELLNNSTYDRWHKYGTLYGITRYSFVVLSDSGGFAENIYNHTRTIYFQMVTLSLATRASILRFSDEITAISDISKDNYPEIVDKTQSLYRNYIRFTNKLYFKEITPQEQGIELYDKIRKFMRIDSDITDLAVEVSKLFNYSYMLQEQDEKEEMSKLTRLGTYLLPPALIAGIFGMNVFGEKISIESYSWIIFIIILMYLSIQIMKLIIKNR